MKALPMAVETAATDLCCPPLGEAPRYSRDEAVRAATSLKALADPARVAIVSILAGRADRALTTREIAPLIDVSEPTVSHHLKKLAAAGLVTPERDGAKVYYRLVIPAVRELAGILDVRCDCGDACCC